MFGIGQWEVIIILVVIFILFGHRLPGVMRSLGRDVVNFRTERIYEQRSWPREPTVSTFQIYLIGIGIFLVLALVAAHLFSR